MPQWDFQALAKTIALLCECTGRAKERVFFLKKIERKREEKKEDKKDKKNVKRKGEKMMNDNDEEEVHYTRGAAWHLSCGNIMPCRTAGFLLMYILKASEDQQPAL